MTRHLVLCAVVCTAACGSAGPSIRTQPDTSPTSAHAAADTARKAATQVPAGLGTLRQDEITVQLRTGSLLVKVTPLDETVIRLAAPDTYSRLSALVENRILDARRMAGSQDVSMYYVSFFSYSPDVPFQPQDLQLSYQGRILNAAAILPVSSGWGKQQLAQQESQSAIYVFSAMVDPTQPLTVRYGQQQSDDWTSIIRKLEVERAKVLSRKPA
jgi:hypothetical protein